MSRTNTTQSRHLSHKEYFKLEQSQDQRFEDIAGEIFALAGGTEAHALIGANALVEFGIRLKDRQCRVYGFDRKLYSAEQDKFCYPDVTVLCESGKRHNLYTESQKKIDILRTTLANWQANKCDPLAGLE